MSDLAFLVGQEVQEVRDGRIIFSIGDKPEPALYADVDACVYQDPSGGRHLIDDSERSESGALSALLGAVVTGTATEDGTLLLVFADGSSLSCPPSPTYEAWQVVGGSPQSLVVCMPEGELAIWDSSHIPSVAEAQQTIERLHELTGWNVQLREITESGGIIVESGPIVR